MILAIAYVNLYGAQDDLVFDGGTFVIGSDNRYILSPQSWQEGCFSYCTSTQKISGELHVKNIDDTHAMYQALMLALRDYIHKSGFIGCLLGLSGGIDSALTATIIADSIGAHNVHCVMTPTVFTSHDSLQDAKTLAQKLQCQFDIIDIMGAYEVLLQTLKPIFADKPQDVSEENLQARVRGTILMSIANKLQKILITTSNKSETAMGYTTLYGDMCGGFALLKDVYKTTVYALAKWRNANIPDHSQFRSINIIPDSILNKEPSAELRLDQKDSDTLPPYALLDKILFTILEEALPGNEIAKRLQIDISLVHDIKCRSQDLIL